MIFKLFCAAHYTLVGSSRIACNNWFSWNRWHNSNQFLLLDTQIWGVYQTSGLKESKTMLYCIVYAYHIHGDMWHQWWINSYIQNQDWHVEILPKGDKRQATEFFVSWETLFTKCRLVQIDDRQSIHCGSNYFIWENNGRLRSLAFPTW